MKLLVLHTFAATAGRQDFYAKVADESGWEITLVTAKRWRNDYGDMVTVSRLPTYSGGLIPVPVALSGNIPLHIYLRSLGRKFARERPDVIYVYHEPYGAATFQAFMGNRLFAGVPIGFYSSQNIRKDYPWPFSATERYVYRRAQFAISVSENVANVLRSKGYEGPLHIVPFSVDTDLFRPAGPPEELATPRRDGCLTVGYAGRLVPEKGVDTLLKALAGLPDEFRGLIVGDGSAADDLRRLSHELGIEDRVEWQPHAAPGEMAGVYHRCDVLAVPSKTRQNWKEQFGRVVIEANASGVPVLVSDSGELPYVVGATRGGAVFPEDGVSELAALLHRAKTDTGWLADLRVEGYRTVVEQFSDAAVVRQFIGAIEASLTA